jgi:hypothetical protein
MPALLMTAHGVSSERIVCAAAPIEFVSVKSHATLR